MDAKLPRVVIIYLEVLVSGEMILGSKNCLIQFLKRLNTSMTSPCNLQNILKDKNFKKS